MWEAWSETFQNLGVCLSLQRWGVNRKGEERSSAKCYRSPQPKEMFLSALSCIEARENFLMDEFCWNCKAFAGDLDPGKISPSYGKFCVSRQDPLPPTECKSLLWWWHSALGQTVCPPWAACPHSATAVPPPSSPPTNPKSCWLGIPAQENPGLSLESRGELRGCSTQGLQKAKPFPTEGFDGAKFSVEKSLGNKSFEVSGSDLYHHVALLEIQTAWKIDIWSGLVAFFKGRSTVITGKSEQRFRGTRTSSAFKAWNISLISSAVSDK